MTFADCAVIKPPPEEAKLCPNGTVVDAASEYVWAPGASLNRLPGDRFPHNDLARSFAAAAIAAQPLDYLREVVADTSLAFAWTPVATPARRPPPRLPPRLAGRCPAYPLIHKVRAEYDPGIRGMSSVEPYGTSWPPTPTLPFLHGPLFGVLLLAGGLGSVGRGRAALLPWGSPCSCSSRRWPRSTSTTATCCPLSRGLPRRRPRRTRPTATAVSRDGAGAHYCAGVRRPVHVPAAMEVIGGRNWWFPDLSFASLPLRRNVS